MDQYSYGAFIMMSVVPFGTPGVAIHFDNTSAEGWSTSQDVPAYAVAQKQVHSQLIQGNTTFRAELSVSETPLELVPRLVPWYTPEDVGAVAESYLIYPDTRMGEDRVSSVWRALQENLSARWDLHTTRHGFLGSMVLTGVDKNVDSPKRESRFRLSFQKFQVADVASIKVQREIRAKKGAAKASGPEWECLEEPPWYLQANETPLIPRAEQDRMTILRAGLEAPQ